MNSFPYSHNAYGWMYILTLLGPEPLIVIIAFRCQETVSVVSTNLNLRVNWVSNNSYSQGRTQFDMAKYTALLMNINYMSLFFFGFVELGSYIYLLSLVLTVLMQNKYVLIDQKSGKHWLKTKGFCLALKWSVYAKGSRFGWLAFH